MIVTEIRGYFKNTRGTLEFDPENPGSCSVEVTIDARGVWSGEPDRDTHLRSADFLDVENLPEIKFGANQLELIGSHDGLLVGDLTIRGVTRKVTLNVEYLGEWQTPRWEDGVDKGQKTRAGYVARTKLDRYDFGVNWNAPLDKAVALLEKL